MFVVTLVAVAMLPIGGLAHAAPAAPIGAQFAGPAAKSSGPSPASQASHGAVNPANVTTTASVAYNIALGNYTYLPTTLIATITVTGASINTTTTSVWMSITDAVNSQLCSTISENKTVTNGNTNYTFLLSPVLLLAGTCPGIQTDPVTISTNVTVLGGLWNTPTVGNGTNVTAFGNVTTALIFSPLSVKLLSPSGSVGIGNATFIAAYTAQYLSSVQLLIWNPAKTSILENTSLIWPSATTPAAVTWFAPAVGSYPYSVTAKTAYGTYADNGNITVLPNGGGTVYLNNSNFKNATLFPGVSGAVAGTILLLVGLIIGMLVALAVASLMRQPTPAPAAQPWQGTSATPPNTCSVCGKSFGSADELAAHAKSEHGMG
jgi:hypothetical protein